MNNIKTEFSSTKFGRTYLKIIDNAKLLNRTKETQILENHHILPKAKGMFPEYESLKENPWNGVLLTPREHFICHSLLVQHYRKINDKTKYRRMSRAFFLMSKVKKINSRLYETMKIDLRQGKGSKPDGFMSGKNNSNAKMIQIFNNKKELILETHGNFKLLVNQHNFPTRYFSKLLRNKIYGTNENYPEYLGWFVKEKNISFNKIDKNTINYLEQLKNKPKKPRKKPSRESIEKMKNSQKGLSIYKDKDGKTFRVKYNDPRVISGELISVNSGVSYKDNIELIEKRKQAIEGMKNPAAKIIKIFDDEDTVKFICEGSFEKTCKENNLPFTSFQQSYLNNGKKLYSKTHKGAPYTKLVNNGNIKYKNWYAKIEN